MHTRQLAGAALCLMVGLVLAGCDEDDVFGGDGVRGSGVMTTESREVSGFDEIVLLGSGDIVVTVTGTESLTIEAEDNIMPLLTSDVSGGRLELGSEESISPTRGITYTITATTFDGVTINGSGNIVASGIDTGSFEVVVNGSGDIDPVGTSEELTVRINGSGNYNGADLIVARGIVNVSGSGSVVVNATDALDVSIGGSGDVEYIGQPTVTQSIGGSGSVAQR